MYCLRLLRFGPAKPISFRLMVVGFWAICPNVFLYMHIDGIRKSYSPEKWCFAAVCVLLFGCKCNLLINENLCEIIFYGR